LGYPCNAMSVESLLAFIFVGVDFSFCFSA
jgi:hypothetical protein